jgi:hypothetical protein
LNSILRDREHVESRAILRRKWSQITGGSTFAQDFPCGLEPVEEFEVCGA